MHISHMRKRTPALVNDKWKFMTRQGGTERTCKLWLYPELDSSWVVQECDSEDGAGQLRYYCQHVQDRYPKWWKSDAVPIIWFVLGDGICEYAPCKSNRGFLKSSENFLTFHTTPISVKTGKPINWFQLPVEISRFPVLAKELGWKPSPFQAYAPLCSIVEGVEQ
jgi:hypothetical protein